MKIFAIKTCLLTCVYLIQFGSLNCQTIFEVNNMKMNLFPTGNFMKYLQEKEYEIPTVFISSLIITGMDTNNNLRLSGVNFFNHFNHGPVTDTAHVDSLFLSYWNNLWIVDATMLDFHQQNYNQTNYIVSEAIATWPAHGNSVTGQDEYLAPFVDVDGDGIYNPLAGDYPKIKGHVAALWIMNDLYKPLSLGIQVIGMVYSYQCISDSAFQFTVFADFEIKNKATEAFSNCYAGLHTDFDVRCGNNFFGTHIPLQLQYAYSADSSEFDYCNVQGVTPFNGSQQVVQGLMVLNGPKLSSTTLDEPHPYFNSVESAFYGFNDGVIDNEIGLLTNSKHHYRTSSQTAMVDPVSIFDYHRMQKSEWRDGTPLFFGGNGHVSDALSNTNIFCTHALPGNSDPLGVGADNNPGLPTWSAVSAAMAAGDIRGSASSGPFDFEPDSTIHLEYAYIYARDYLSLGNEAPLPILFQRAQAIRDAYVQQLIPCQPLLNVTDVVTSMLQLNVFPNPTNGELHIESAESIDQIEVFNLQGQKLLTISKSDISVIDLSWLNAGFYLIRCYSRKETVVKTVFLNK